MIQPVRPVGCHPATMPAHCGRMTRSLDGGPKAHPHRPSLPCAAWNWRSLAGYLRSKALGLERFCNLLGLQFVTRPVCRFERPSADVAAVMPHDYLDSLPPFSPESVEPWQPWPAHEPFADEITRWWPSNEYPPPQPPIVYEDRIPNRPPVIADWYALGGVVDAYA